MKIEIEKNPEKRLSLKERQQRVGKGFVYHESHQPFVKIKVLLKNLETEPEIYVNKIEKRMYQIPNLISFLRVFEKVKKGRIFIHGAAIADENGQGFLFGARQDIGKTTLTLLLSKHGYFILGDDFLDLSKNGVLYRVQDKMGIFPHPENLRGLPLSLKEKFVGWFKYHFLVRPPFCHLAYPNLRVNYKKLKRVKDEAKLVKVFILEKGKPSIFEIDKEKAVRKILATTFEACNFIPPEGFPGRLFYIYCFANDISPNFVEKEYERILNSAFCGKRIFGMRGENPFDFCKLFLEHEKR